MTQNDNLFNFDQPPSEQPQPPRQEPQSETPQQPFSAGEPQGAQVYSTPPSYQAEPPPYTPPPPVQRNNNRVWIIAIVVILLLCCCCLVLAGVWLYNNGDQYLQEFSRLAPALAQALA